MDPSTYIDRRADLLVDVSETVEAKQSAYIIRWLELLDNPDQRSDLLIEDAVGYLEERDAEEGGDPESSAVYAEQLLDYTGLTWREIHEVPPQARGDLWWTARKMVAAICQTQAIMEATAGDLLNIGNKMGTLTKQAAKMSEADKRKAATEGTTKRIVAEKAAARKATVNTEG